MFFWSAKIVTRNRRLCADCPCEKGILPDLFGPWKQQYVSTPVGRRNASLPKRTKGRDQATSTGTNDAAWVAAEGSTSEEILHFVHEALRSRVMLVAVFPVYFLQLAQEFLLAIGQADRGFHDDMTHQIAC